MGNCPEYTTALWEAKEARIATLEAEIARQKSTIGGYEAGTHSLRTRAKAAEAKLRAVEGLPDEWRRDGCLEGGDCANDLEARLRTTNSASISRN